MFLIMTLLSSLITVMSSDMTTAGFVFRKEKTSPRILYSLRVTSNYFSSRNCYVYDFFNNNNEDQPIVPCEFTCLSEEYPEPYCPNLTTTSSSWHETQRKVIATPLPYMAFHEFDCVTFSYCIPEQIETQQITSAENHVCSEDDKNQRAPMSTDIAILVVLCFSFFTNCVLLVIVFKATSNSKKRKE